MYVRSMALIAAFALTISSASAQPNCLQRRLGPPPAHYVSHWIVTNVCGHGVQFSAYMSGTGGTYNVYTTPLGKLIDPNPGLPITIVIPAGKEQSFYFSSGGRAGHWNFITDNVTRVY